MEDRLVRATEVRFRIECVSFHRDKNKNRLGCLVGKLLTRSVGLGIGGNGMRLARVIFSTGVERLRGL